MDQPLAASRCPNANARQLPRDIASCEVKEERNSSCHAVNYADMPKPADAFSPAVEAVIWTDGPHAPLISRLLDVMGHAVRVLAVGGPRVAPVAELAHRLGHEPTDDLRHTLISHPAPFAVIATTDAPDAGDLQTAARAGALPLCLEPLAADFDQLHALQKKDGKDAAPPPAVQAPAMLQAPGFLLAAHPFDLLGERRTLLIESLGPAGAGSVFARLLDAWRTALAFIEMPQAIDAQVTPAPETSGPAGAAASGNAGTAELPATLRGLTGRITAHGRAADGGSITLTISDRAIEHRRRLLALSDQSQLEVTDTAYRFHAADGSPIDQGRHPDEALRYVDLIAHQWRRLIDRAQTDAAAGTGLNPSPSAGDALACCLACLLSARTGQPEDPRTLQRLR